MNDTELLRRLGRAFIWLGVPACLIQLTLELPSVRSLSSFLLTLTDLITRLSGTVGLGGVLLALAAIAESLRAGAAELPSSEQEVS